MENKQSAKIIAVDFDGCLVTNKWPNIGEPIEKNINKLWEETEAGAKIILWTCRVGDKLVQALAWCDRHNIFFDAVNDNLPEIIESFGYNPRKIFANEYWDDRAVLVDEVNPPEPEEKSSLEKWAENEIAIACKAERSGDDNPDGDEWDYGCACYESALKAFKALLSAGHSGMSISITKHILNRLIDGLPLRPIEDTPDVWNNISHCQGDNSRTEYQCRRMPSLFKTVYSDGRTTYRDYRDIDSSYCIDINNHSCTYPSGSIRKIIEEMYPVTMPYMPGEPIKVYCSDCLTDEKNGDYDTQAIFYLVKPDGERVEVNRFFKESDDGWVEIDKVEYDCRKEAADILMATRLR